MILLLDNFDSFTYNLVDYFHRIGVESRVFRNNESLDILTKEEYQAVVLSPGPETPYKAGNLMKVLAYYCKKVPVLGICLGHQAIGMHFGAELEKGKRPMHGKISKINLHPHYLWDGIASPTKVVRYHSLVINKLPEDLEILAETDETEVMAIQHKFLPVCGLQFHPEAVLTENGLQMLRNWAKHHKLTAGK